MEDVMEKGNSEGRGVSHSLLCPRVFSRVVRPLTWGVGGRRDDNRVCKARLGLRYSINSSLNSCTAVCREVPRG